MRRDGTPDEFDRDREAFEDRVQLAKQAADAVYLALENIGVNPGRSNKMGMYAAIKNAVAAVLAQAQDDP